MADVLAELPVLAELAAAGIVIVDRRTGIELKDEEGNVINSAMWYKFRYFAKQMVIRYNSNVRLESQPREIAPFRQLAVYGVSEE